MTQHYSQIAALNKKDEGVINSFLSECFDYHDGDFDRLESISAYRKTVPSFLENQFWVEKRKEIKSNCSLKRLKENGKIRKTESSLRNMKLKMGRK